MSKIPKNPLRPKMKGKIIVITGIDGTGKETQSKKLLEHLLEQGVNAKLQSFPNYTSPSSAPVKEYLQGKLGVDAKSLTPMQASSLFLVDFLETMLGYKEFLDKGGVLILDRYTESNLIHQAGRLATSTEQVSFANSYENLAYNMLKLPKPDMVLCLTMPLKTSLNLIQNRALKNGGEKDVHENEEHLKTAHKMCMQFAQAKNWTVVNCVDSEGNLRTPERIANNVANVVDKFLQFGITQDYSAQEK